MKPYTVALLLCFPVASSIAAIPKPVTTVKVVSQAHVREALTDPASAKFGLYGEYAYQLAEDSVLVACGTVNAKGDTGRYIGDQFYFVTYLKKDGKNEFENTQFGELEELEKQLHKAAKLAEDDPERQVTVGLGKCVMKMK